MKYTEDDLIPLSYLSQYYYCPRRAGLLLLEQQWQDNLHTAEGSLLHERVHSGKSESRGTVKILRGVHLRSLELGITGVADCVELEAAAGGVSVSRLPGTWAVGLVEYKHGKVRCELEYEVQLCAQAMCLEQMWGCKIAQGHIYYGGDRRRKLVDFTPSLRGLVVSGCVSLHTMLTSCALPAPTRGAKCRECSMEQVCLPRRMGPSEAYVESLLQVAQGGDSTEENP